MLIETESTCDEKNHRLRVINKQNTVGMMVPLMVEMIEEYMDILRKLAFYDR